MLIPFELASNVLNDAYNKREGDMLTLISRAQLCAGVPIVEAELLFGSPDLSVGVI
jgi:hypothetical protein